MSVKAVARQPFTESYWLHVQGCRPSNHPALFTRRLSRALRYFERSRKCLSTHVTSGCSCPGCCNDRGIHRRNSHSHAGLYIKGNTGQVARSISVQINQNSWWEVSHWATPDVEKATLADMLQRRRMQMAPRVTLSSVSFACYQNRFAQLRMCITTPQH